MSEFIREFELPEHLDAEAIQDLDDKGGWARCWLPDSKHGKPIALERTDGGFNILIGVPKPPSLSQLQFDP